MLELLPHPAEATSLSQTARMTVHEVGGFWAVCDAGRYHRVIASRVVFRSPGGGSFQAYTRLSLPGGIEVRRLRGDQYRAGRLGRLVRLGGPRRMDG
jgi:hypothetical protein